ncbi:MAG: hypothetical protein GXX96_16270 [Planctomycetaceae bacterium]|nr:hypothetical protein [Planctomycetaceae bacterium]
MFQQRLTFTHHGLLALVVLGAVLIGGLCGRPPAGQSNRLPAGQVPQAEEYPAGHFLAGGERSVPVLEKISATLDRIDERLARLERIALEAAETEK